MQIVKPRRLRPGDQVAVLSPSWGGPSLYPHVFDLGLWNIETLFGLKIKEYPTARMPDEELYRNPKLRAEDINRAFADDEVAAIFASIGGDDSVRILPYLDMEAILQRPKILMGFSDTTTLTSYLNWHGMVTFNGPSIMAGFAQMRHLPEPFREHIRSMLMGETSGLEYEPYDVWADKYEPWSNLNYTGETAPLNGNVDGWRWLQGAQPVEGRLYGGCIEVFEFLKGTAFWPSSDFFKGRVLFFETSEEKPTVSNVKYMLRNYGSMGVLDSVEAILFGRARSYSDDEKAALDKVLVQVVAREFGKEDMPIVSNMDFGHTDPQFVMPLGVNIRIDSAAKSIRLTESPTEG